MSLDADAGFLHARVPGRRLGVSRAVVGVAAGLKALEAGPILTGILRPEVIRFRYFDALPDPPPSWVVPIVVVWTGLAVAFAFGWRTRVVGTLLVGVMGWTLALDQQAYSNHLYLLLVVTALLVVADAGAAISLDARRRGERAVSWWSVVLLRVQTSLVYGFATLAKLNLVFISGAVLLATIPRSGALGLPEALRRPEVLAPLAMASVLMEAALAVGPWFRRWRHQVFALALPLHLGMILFITPEVRTQILIFALVMFALLHLFLPHGPGRQVVVWDGACSFCGTWIRWLRRFDWTGAFEFRKLQSLGDSEEERRLREQAERAIQLLGPDGRVEGFDAVRCILEHLPVSFLWAPWLRVPPIPRLGRALYRRVAARRTCAVPHPP